MNRNGCIKNKSALTEAVSCWFHMPLLYWCTVHFCYLQIQSCVQQKDRHVDSSSGEGAQNF